MLFIIFVQNAFSIIYFYSKSYFYREWMFFIRFGSRHQKYFKTVQQHSRFWSEYFRETLLHPQRTVAVCWLTDSLLELAVDGRRTVWCRLLHFLRGCNQVYVGETKRTLGERVKEHTANIANNLSAVAEHHQKTGHKPDLDNIKVLCRSDDKLIPRKVREDF